MGGAGMGGGMPMGGVGMSPLSSLSALTGKIPGLSSLTRSRYGSTSRGAGPPSSAAKIPVGEVSFTGLGTFAKGPAAMSAAINAALDARGVTDPVARRNWHNGYMTLTGRESGHNATVVNLSDSNARGAQMSDGPPPTAPAVLHSVSREHSRGITTPARRRASMSRWPTSRPR